MLSFLTVDLMSEVFFFFKIFLYQGVRESTLKLVIVNIWKCPSGGEVCAAVVAAFVTPPPISMGFAPALRSTAELR